MMGRCCVQLQILLCHTSGAKVGWRESAFAAAKMSSLWLQGLLKPYLIASSNVK